jgi:hypothetical protein
MAVIWELGFALSGFILLLTWRPARRFGGRGLAVALAAAAVLGPVRDYRYLERFPEWGCYAPGVRPVLAVSATCVVMGVPGHEMMWLAAGPARADRLAQRPWAPAA